MTDPILAALLVLIVCLFATTALPVRLRRKVRHACTVLSAAGLLLAIAATLADAPPASIQLPFGLPGQSIHVTLDPIASGMVLLLFLAGLPVAAFSAEAGARASPPSPSVPVILAGLALAILASDTIVMAAGLSATAIGVWAGMTPGRDRSITLGAMLGAAGGLFIAVGLISPPLTEAAAGSAVPLTQGPDSDTAFLCAVASAGALAGLAPLHMWLTRTTAQASPAINALLCGALAPVAIGLLTRVALTGQDFAPPVWWAWSLLLLGGVTAVTGGWRAASGTEISLVAVAAAQRVVGLAIVDLGLVVMGRAVDLPELAALALAGMVMWAAVLAVCAPLAILAAAVLQTAAGSRRLDRMGGLFHFLPRSSSALLAGLAGMAAFPPAAGFAAMYLTFQAILSAPRTPDLIPSLLIAATVAVQGLGLALGVTAAVRAFGVVCLGRPRTPRAAAAAEAPRAIRLILLGVLGITAVLGLFPGVVLDLFAGSAIAQLTGLELGDRAGVFYLGGGVGASGYAPLPLAALLGMCGGMALWLWRPDTRPGSEAVPVWQDGFPATTGWMPFGDPLTQSSGVGFVPPGRPFSLASALPDQAPAPLPSPRLSVPRTRPALILSVLIPMAWIQLALIQLARLQVSHLRVSRPRATHLRVRPGRAPLALLVVLAAVLAILGGGGG